MKRARCVLLIFAFMIAAIGLPGAAAAHPGHTSETHAITYIAGAPQHADTWLQNASMLADPGHTCDGCCHASTECCCVSCVGAANVAATSLLLMQLGSDPSASLMPLVSGLAPDPDPHPPKASPVL